MIGRTLGHYEIIEPLGAGGMGEVYRARDSKLKRHVAVKVLPEEMTSSQDRLERFQREAEALAALDHPNIVTIYSVEEAEGVRFLTMQLVEGEQLTKLIPKGGLPLDRIFDIAIPLADALATAHAQGIVHRDLKPGNIMVTDEGRVKVLDFGLAKLRQEQAPSEDTELATATELPAAPLTQEGRILGTMPYMSPEQLEGMDLDARSDIFSLGAVLYEMATGERPFLGDTQVSLISSIVKDEPRPVTAVREDLPNDLGRIVRRCLEKDRERRFQSTKEIRNELEDLRTGVISGSGEAPRPAIASSLRARRRAAWVSGLAALAVIVAVAGLYLYRDWASSQGPGETANPIIETLAVLPMENRSGDDPEQEQFATVMTEQLITDLSKVGSLSVILPPSVMLFRDTDKPLPEIAAELKVDGLVIASVFRAGDQVHVTARLVHAATSEVLWSDSYDRDLQDLFNLVSEITLDIVAGIQIELTAQEENLLASTGPVDPEVQVAYLRGRNSLYSSDEGGFRRAIGLFEQAIAHDPDYAPAYAGLADAYILLSNFAMLSPSEAGPKAKEAAERAVELDSSLAEAHSSLALAEVFFDWNLSAAEPRYRRALELSPNDFHTLAWGYKFYLLLMGRFEECLELQRQAVQLDPITANVGLQIGFTLFNARRYQESIDQVVASLPFDPDGGVMHSILVGSYSKLGQHEDAIDSAEQLVTLLGEDQQALAIAAWALGRAGRDQRAREISDRLSGLAAVRWVDPFYEAVALGGLGEINLALNKLEHAYELHSPLMLWLRVSPWLDPLREEPRFQELLQRVNFPE